MESTRFDADTNVIIIEEEPGGDESDPIDGKVTALMLGHATTPGKIIFCMASVI